MKSKKQFTCLSIAATLLTLAAPVSANEILVTFILEDYRHNLVYGQELAEYIDIVPGFNVTQRILDDAIYDDYDTFDQIWVYDFSIGANNSPTQVANYAAIAAWFNNQEQPNLIADGRIASSTQEYTDANLMSSEAAWIQNYASQLASRGGGLVLGTDHAAPGQSSGGFVDGINEINALIGINPFRGHFGGYPTSQASVDAQSPLAILPLDHCRVGDGPCINDNSTTSFAPAGEQPGDLFLTPIAYHGTTTSAFENAAVSSTMESPTFSTTVPEPTTILGSLAVFATALFCKKKKN